SAELGVFAQQGRRARVGLHAAGLAAAALGGLRAGIDVDVPDLAREAVGARVQLPADHQAAADAGAEGDHEERRIAGAVAVQVLAERRRRGVVLDGHRAAQAIAQPLPELDALEAGHVREPPAAPRGIDLPGDRDADAARRRIEL